MIQIKNAKELDGMRKANALSAAALKYGGEHIEAGMTTWELDKLIYDFIVKHGGTPNFKGLYGFPGTACISLNDTIIHGIPSHDIVIRPGDIVSIDTGAKIDGFNGDNACTYAVGKIDLEAQRLLDVTKAALYKGIEAAKAGNRIGDALLRSPLLQVGVLHLQKVFPAGLRRTHIQQPAQQLPLAVGVGRDADVPVGRVFL